jgi:hypothetical protein
MLRAAAMFEPAHERLVLREHLHAIDAEIVIVFARIARAFGHHQRPGDERRGLARPAGLDGQAARSMSSPRSTICWQAGEPTVLGRIDITVRASGSSSIASPKLRGGSGWRKVASSFAHFAHRGRIAPLDAVHGDAHRDALHRAEQIGEHGNARRRAVGLERLFEDDGRAAFGQQPRLDFRHLEHGRDGFRHAHKLAFGFQPGNEVAQRAIAHRHRPITAR